MWFSTCVYACYIDYHDFVVIRRLSSKLVISKTSLGNTNRVSNGLNPECDGNSVGPDLGLNCLPR